MIDINYSLPCRETNYSKNRSKIQYIVIHYTGDDGATARNEATYFNRDKVEASAHYFIDNDSIYASVPEDCTAWSVGVKYGEAPFWGLCKHNNSISLELCTFGGEIQQGTIDNAKDLTRHLMDKYGIPIDNVIRHYDVCHKICPAPWVNQGDVLWNLFKLYVAGAEAQEIKPAPTPQPEQIDWEGLRRYVVSQGQDWANKFVGHDEIAVDGVVGPATRRMKVRVIQHAMNLDYCGPNAYVKRCYDEPLVEDGLWGSKTEAALANHYIEKDETQYMVTAMEIFVLIAGNNPNGVEMPGIFGKGLANALNTDYCDRNFIKFCALV